MRFLIDENVKLKLLRWLSESGHDAIRVPSGTRNGRVLALGIAESRILITHDHDFADRYRYPPDQYAGIILIEIHPPVLSALKTALSKLLKTSPPQGFSGRLIVLGDQGYHVAP
jgi:predicted nuclease of predicted toxin-antitoxin system